MNLKIKLLILFNHLAAIYGLFYGNLWMLLFTIIGFQMIKLGGEIGLHRYFCHKSFKTTKPKHYMLMLFAMLNCFGPPLAWVGVHRKHHAFSDTPLDPHGCQPAWRIWFTFWKPFNIEVKYVKDLMKDKDQVFVFNYYFLMIFLIWGSLFLINWQLPIFLISIPSLMSFHLAGLVNTVCHTSGDHDYDTKDHSFNNRWVNMITMGSGLHNTHHADPSGWDNRRKPGDIDFYAWMIEKWLIVKEP